MKKKTTIIAAPKYLLLDTPDEYKIFEQSGYLFARRKENYLANELYAICKLTKHCEFPHFEFEPHFSKKQVKTILLYPQTTHNSIP